jgi:hypothetical protein
MNTGDRVLWADRGRIAIPTGYIDTDIRSYHEKPHYRLRSHPDNLVARADRGAAGS